MNTPTHTVKTFQNFDVRQTESLLDYSALIAALRKAMSEYARGEIASPPRLITPLNEGGLMLSMPAAASDLAMHKLVNVTPANRDLGLPTIHGQVVAWDAQTGEPCFALDGPTVTGRRTAAISMLGIHTLCQSAPKNVLLIGSGKQGANHVEALASQFPNVRIWVMGRALSDVERFCKEYAQEGCELIACDKVPSDIDVVITTTTSKLPVYHEAARADRLIVAVGAFQPTSAEIAADVVHGSTLYVDDWEGAKHEAGDYILAGADWANIHPLVNVKADTLNHAHPKMFKSVGCAAWDLAACRVAKQALG